MSFESYPIVTFGSNVDQIRQGHNLITTNVGDIAGLLTQNNSSVVDAINSLQIAFDALIVSAYPPLNNEQWLTANNFAGSGTLNLFKVSSADELIVGRHLIPFSSTTDLGKTGTGFRSIFGTTLYITTITAHSPSTRIDLNSTAGFDFKTNSTTLSLTEVSTTQIKLESTADQLDIISTRTRILSGAHAVELSTSGHLLPVVNETQEFGASDKRIKKTWTKDLDVTGAINFPSDYGGQVPIGAGMLWFGPDNQVPTNYLILRGDVASQATYPVLFTLYGTTFNTGGEGVGNFRLPDMRSRIPFGANASQVASPDASSPGKTFGAINHSHSVPAHRHLVGAVTIATDQGAHVHGSGSFSGSNADFNPRLQVPTHGHGHTLGTNDNSHVHGAGTLSATDTNIDHDHGIRVGNSGSVTVGSDVRSFSGFTGAGVMRTPSPSLTGTAGGSHSHAISGLTQGDTHSHTITGSISDQPAFFTNYWSDTDNASRLAANAHVHSISSSGTHGHTVPAHYAGSVVVDGDAAMTSGTNNPPCFALWFIVRAK